MALPSYASTVQRTYYYAYLFFCGVVFFFLQHYLYLSRGRLTLVLSGIPELELELELEFSPPAASRKKNQVKNLTWKHPPYHIR